MLTRKKSSARPKGTIATFLGRRKPLLVFAAPRLIPVTAGSVRIPTIRKMTVMIIAPVMLLSFVADFTHRGRVQHGARLRPPSGPGRRPWPRRAGRRGLHGPTAARS